MPAHRSSIGGPALIAGAALPVALLAGVLVATRLGLGIAFALAIAFGVIALLDLPIAIALWIALAFSRNLTIVWIGPTLASLMVLLGWLGAPRDGWRPRAAVLARHRLIVVAVLALAIWLTLTAWWARDPGAVAANAWTWWAAALVAVVVATALRTPRDARAVIGGFVVGAAVSVFVGLVLTGLQPVSDAVQSAAHGEPKRLSGGLADPNYLAAGLVPAIVLGCALLSAGRGLVGRLVIAASVALCAVGLVATESRGGLIAAGAAAVASLVVFPQRGHVALGLVLVVAVGGVYLAGTPRALDRIGALDGGGNGRADLWRVAWRIGETQPVAGIGLGNFVSRSQDFVREPGALRDVHVIVERPVLVHNIYLQTWVEAGLVGLALFLAVLGGLLVLPLRAARRFDARGDPAMATLARAVFVAQLSALVALVFLSAGTDWRWWTLFGLGPALLAMALHGAAAVPAAPAGLRPMPPRRPLRAPPAASRS